MSLYLLVIFAMLLNKFIQYPVANSIKFEKSYSNFCISICSLPYAYDVNKARTDELLTKDTNFQLSYILFWKKWRNVSTMIHTMTINNGTNDIDVITSQNKDSRYFSVFPYNNVTVAICNTFDLSQHNTINQIHVVYYTEIEIYFHLKGQLLNEWIRKKTKFLPSSLKNIRIVGGRLNPDIEVSDTAAFIAVEFKSSIRSLFSSQNFDDCFKTKGRKLLGAKLIECYLDGEFETECLNITNMRFEKLARFLQNNTVCPSPQTYINTLVSQSNYLNTTTLKISNSQKNTQSRFMEDLGLSNMSRDSKPSVTLKFPLFTKISQVSTCF